MRVNDDTENLEQDAYYSCSILLRVIGTTKQMAYSKQYLLYHAYTNYRGVVKTYV